MIVTTVRCPRHERYALIVTLQLERTTRFLGLHPQLRHQISHGPGRGRRGGRRMSTGLVIRSSRR